MKALRIELNSLKERLSKIEAANKAPLLGETVVNERVQSNTIAIADCQNRLSKLEQAILANPSKALEIPLLQRDLESIRASQATSVASMKDSVDRVYDQNKWLLGGVSVSILALGISSLLRAKATQG